MPLPVEVRALPLLVPHKEMPASQASAPPKAAPTAPRKTPPPRKKPPSPRKTPPPRKTAVALKEAPAVPTSKPPALMPAPTSHSQPKQTPVPLETPAPRKKVPAELAVPTSKPPASVPAPTSHSPQPKQTPAPMETPAPLEITTCGPPLQEAVPSKYACRDTGRDVPFLNPGKCLGCQKMLSANVWTFSMTRLCREGDGELPSLYNACSKSCKAKFNGEKKSPAARQTILRQARGSILGTKIAEGDTVYVFDDKTPNRFVDAGPGVVLRRQYNKATGQADLVVSSLLNTAVRTVGPSGRSRRTTPRPL
ncbi:hypothetical protein M885DRAFT_500819 [Pelagophyceae sp. CCMP2097]|nr:hypothetical protein M885DRAFT_500819 [Pelagophyceae sp. CCMP2097]